MALTSVYYDGPVTEGDRARNLGGVPEYGVYGPDDFKVTAHPSIPFAVLVKAGRAHGCGVTDTAAEDQVIQCATLAAGDGVRWDLIAVHRDWQPLNGGPSELIALQAGASAAIPPARQNVPGDKDDQPLFLVKWQGGVSAPVDFIDLRCWAGNGSMVAKDKLALGYLSRVGTRVMINREEWVRELDANGSPVWTNLDAPGPWVNMTPGNDWVVPPGNAARCRVIGRGRFLEVRAYVRYGGTKTVVPGWIAARFPAGVAPSQPFLVPALTEGSSRLGAVWIGPQGIELGPDTKGTTVHLAAVVALG